MAASSPATSKRRRRPRAALATGASAAQVKALYDGIAYEEVPLDAMRRTIAKRLIEAKQTIPHFYLTADHRRSAGSSPCARRPMPPRP